MAHQAVTIITLVLVAAVFVNAIEKEIKALEECNKKIKAPPSAIDKLLNLESPDSSKEGKCLIKCGLEAFNLMREDGSIDEENSYKYIIEAYYKPENQKRVNEIWIGCIHKVEKVEDNCEHAYGLMACFVDVATKENIPKIHSDKN